MIGSTLSHYEITAELGRGGMGIVYRATDTKLNREVALKILPAAALASEEDRARFFREAQAAAQLHHPNIATVFEIDEAILKDADGNKVNATDSPRPYIAMEFVTGETLQETIKKAPLKLADAVNITSQVAEALKAAHAKEIVHRDIKSPNVMITEDGIAKVLDFGLAKTNNSTMLTRMGSTLGTVAYMSPEQARGQEVDGRSDLYSLGTMMYEMICGSLPFAGEYEQAVVYGILNESPEPLTSKRTGVPMQLEWIVNKLLAKEADYRYQSAAGLLADLMTVDLSGSGQSRCSMPAASSTAVSGQTTLTGRSASLPAWMLPVLGVAILAAAAGGWFLRPQADIARPPTARYSITLQDQEIFPRLWFSAMALSPDGSRLAYRSTNGLFIQRLDDPKERIQIPERGNFGSPVFSPDGEWLLYYHAGSGLLKRVPVSGGSARDIASTGSIVNGKYWAEDGNIYFTTGRTGLWRVSERGGAPEFLHGTSGYYSTPWLLPGNRYLLFGASTSLSSPSIRVFDLKQDSSWVLIDGFMDPHYVQQMDRLLTYSNGSIFEMEINLDDMVVVGNPAPLSQDIRLARSSRGGHWTVSETGVLASIHGGWESETGGTTLSWFDPETGLEPVLPDLHNYRYPRVSPSGDQISVAIVTEDPPGLYVLDSNRGSKTYLYTDSPVSLWSPDEKQVAFVGKEDDILVLQVDNPSDVDTLFAWTGATLPTQWTSDGRFIVFGDESTGGGNSDLYFADLENETVEVFLEGSSDSDFGAISPNGKWIAVEYSTDGLEEIIVMDFPVGRNRIQVSTNGGSYPIWHPDGTSLFFESSREIWNVPIDQNSGVPGTPSLYFSGPVTGTGRGFPQFDVHPDGKKLLVLMPAQSEDQNGFDPEVDNRVDIVVNWFTELEKR